MNDFPEQDWRIFRDLSKVALDRFFSRIFDEVAKLVTDESRPPTDRYHKLYKLIQKRDREVADAFDNPRRSTALTQLLRLRGMKLITDEEFARFSELTQKRVKLLLDM